MATKKPKPENPVTPQADAAFDLFVRKWQQALNLLDWRIERGSKPAAKANCAEIHGFDLGARLATYRIGTNFGSTHVNEASVEQIACHEVCHVLLHELIEFAKDPKSNESDVESAEHRVVNTLVQILVPER